MKLFKTRGSAAHSFETKIIVVLNVVYFIELVLIHSDLALNYITGQSDNCLYDSDHEEPRTVGAEMIPDEGTPPWYP